MEKENTGKPQKSPVLAAILSFFIGGAGQIYNGQAGKGLLIFFTSWLIVPWIIGIFDAYNIAKKINEGVEIKKSPEGCAVAAIVVMAFLVIFIPIFMLLTAIAVPNFVMARQTAMANKCISNLKAIESAKQIWAVSVGASGDAAPSWPDLIPRYIAEKPKCPEGGRYSIGSLLTPASCSIGDKGTSSVKDDHIIKWGR